MARYIIKRILVSFPLLLGITFITFIFINLAPGDFLDNLRMNPQISEETLRLYEEQFHLNKPLMTQYFVWLKNLFRLDFGYSFAYSVPVFTVISSRAFNTLLLSISSIFLTWIFVIPLGVIACVYKNRFPDRALSFLAYIAISTPSFFVAFILLYWGMISGGLPLGGMRSVYYDDLSRYGKIIDVARHLIIPAAALSLGRVAALQRILRANLLDALNSPYVTAAKARGISGTRIFYIHVLKNAINPMITIFGYQFSGLLSGAVLIEIICGWPGLGVITLEAVRMQDIYLVMGSVIMSGVLLIAGNLLADVLLAVFDPRIRYEKTA